MAAPFLSVLVSHPMISTRRAAGHRGRRRFGCVVGRRGTGAGRSWRRRFPTARLGEDDLAFRRLLVELADGDDLLDLGDEVLHRQAEHVNGRLARVEAGARVAEELDELGDRRDVDLLHLPLHQLGRQPRHAGDGAEPGGQVHSSLTLVNSTVSGNTAGGSGGIDAFMATVSLTNSSVTGNHATGAATDGCLFGGVYYSCAGGIWNYHGTLALTNSVVSGNDAAYRGGGMRNDASLD